MVEITPKEYGTVDELLDGLQNDPTLTYVAVPAGWLDGKKIKSTAKSVVVGGRTKPKEMHLEMNGKQYLVIMGADSVSKYVIKVR
jgi:hypothetical protein